VVELERGLREYLGVKHLFFVSNGTIAIQIALKAACDTPGEIITTPFSYVATTSSIVWEGHRPVFADIDPETLCLDPVKAEALITPATRAILATHVFGTPCDIDAFDALSARTGIPVIYDAAHAFGVTRNGSSILRNGAVSTLSFHATKVFHTAEGGGIVTEDDALAHKISYLRNFGHNGPEAFQGLGVNGKCSEFHAAMGLAVLPHVPRLIRERRELSDWYKKELSSVIGVPNSSYLSRPTLHTESESNFSYYPVLFRCEEELLECVGLLKEAQITPRRYFYPSLATLPYVHRPAPTPITDEVCKRILCLPFYPGMTHDDVRSVSDVILGFFASMSGPQVANL
jgi:dTDP-4-amino-4,6-dideoxygalactose transaminase